jgi:hypothetical protein
MDADVGIDAGLVQKDEETGVTLKERSDVVIGPNGGFVERDKPSLPTLIGTLG